MNIRQPWRAAAFAKKRPAASILACGGSVSHVAWLPSGRYLNAQYPLRSGLWHPLNVPLPPAPLRAAGSSMADARSAAQPSSPPRSPLGQQSRRLSKRAFKRTAQPAGPTPCWSSRLEGARGSGMVNGCQSLVEGIFGLRPTPSACRDFTMQNALFLMSRRAVPKANTAVRRTEVAR